MASMIESIARIIIISLICIISSINMNNAHAFGTGGCDPDCKKCHSLEKHEVEKLLGGSQSRVKVLDIHLSQIKSLWEVSIEDKDRKKTLFYLDFSKKFLIPGPINIVEISTAYRKQSEKSKKKQEIRKIDISKIPLQNTLVMGDGKGPKKLIVFTDPDCPFCGKLHQEIKKIMGIRKDITFYLKLFPLLTMHKDSYWKAKSIACNKSLKMLEDNFDNMTIPKTDCNTQEIDDNIKLAESLSITGTPTIILPDGRLISGALPSDKIIELIDGGR